MYGMQSVSKQLEHCTEMPPRRAFFWSMAWLDCMVC